MKRQAALCRRQQGKGARGASEVSNDASEREHGGERCTDLDVVVGVHVVAHDLEDDVADVLGNRLLRDRLDELRERHLEALLELLLRHEARVQH